MTRLRLKLIAAWVASLAWAAGATGEKTPPLPRVVRAEPAPEWDAKFTGNEGWVGGDGAYSVMLGPRRVLWLFGDTLLGTVRNGGRPGAAMVNNTVGIQDGADGPIRFVSGKGAGGKPAAVFAPAGGKGWFWPLAAVRDEDRLFVFLARVERGDESGPFGFKPAGTWLAVVDNPDDEPGAWRVRQRAVPFAGPRRSWGSAVLAEGDTLYVYGYAEEGEKLGLKRRLTVAKVAAGKLDDFDAWRFRTRDGWSRDASAAAPLADRFGTEFSVSRVPGGKGYTAVYTENGLGDRILARFTDEPAGPWSAPVPLYTCPEMRKDKGVFCYAAKAHPWASGRGELLVSYCVNTWEFARLFRDEAVYRPKFVRVKLGPAG